MQELNSFKAKIIYLVSKIPLARYAILLYIVVMLNKSKYLIALKKCTSQENLSRVLGRSISTASRIMSGKQEPSADQMILMVENIRGLNYKDFH